jgi:phage repressor protein C with HTH and peptisase S24 domain
LSRNPKRYFSSRRKRGADKEITVSECPTVWVTLFEEVKGMNGKTAKSRRDTPVSGLNQGEQGWRHPHERRNAVLANAAALDDDEEWMHCASWPAVSGNQFPRASNSSTQATKSKPPFTSGIPAGTMRGMDADRGAIRQLIFDALGRHTFKLADLARVSGLKAPTLSKIANERVTPNPETCRKLAPWLGVSADHLLELAGHKESSSERQRLQTRDELLDRLMAVDATEVGFHDFDASGSPGRSIWNDPVEYAYLPERRRYARGRIRGITVRGDCMAPAIRDGDMVFIDTQAEWEDGDVVLAVVDDALHLKRLRSSDVGWLLAPDNGEPPIPVTDGVFILGTFMGLWRRGL